MDNPLSGALPLYSFDGYIRRHLRLGIYFINSIKIVFDPFLESTIDSFKLYVVRIFSGTIKTGRYLFVFKITLYFWPIVFYEYEAWTVKEDRWMDDRIRWVQRVTNVEVLRPRTHDYQEKDSCVFRTRTTP